MLVGGRDLRSGERPRREDDRIFRTERIERPANHALEQRDRQPAAPERSQQLAIQRPPLGTKNVVGGIGGWFVDASHVSSGKKSADLLGLGNLADAKRKRGVAHVEFLFLGHLQHLLVG